MVSKKILYRIITLSEFALARIVKCIKKINFTLAKNSTYTVLFQLSQKSLERNEATCT